MKAHKTPFRRRSRGRRCGERPDKGLRACVCSLRGRPRRLGLTQGTGGTRNVRTSVTLHTRSVSLAAIAGVQADPACLEELNSSCTTQKGSVRTQNTTREEMKGFPTFAPHWLLLGSLFPTLRTLSSGFSPLNASFFDRVLSSDRTEVLGIQWAIDELPGLAEKYGSEAEFQIKMVTP